MVVIWWRRCHWVGVLGERSFSSSYWKVSKVAGHSLGRRGDWEQRPCWREFWEEIFFPEGERGPVDFWAFLRLAARRLREMGEWGSGEVGGEEEREGGRFWGAW